MDLQNKLNKLENMKNNISQEDYKQVIALINEVDESYKVLKEHVVHNLTLKNLKESILEAVLPYNINEIDDIDIDELKEVINENSIRNRVYELTDDEAKEIFIMVKENSNLLLSSKIDTEKIKKDSTEVLKEYYNLASTNKVKELREQRLATLKEQVVTEQDPYTKSKMERMIKTIEDSFSFNFIKERLTSLQEKEIKAIEEAFFSEKKGLYIFERFEKKIVSFGYSKDIFKNFYNIEENLLPDVYHPFNNLFLFNYIRFVAYADASNKNDKMYVHAITTALSNLIYHRFEKPELEDEFIDVIKSVDDFFKDDVELFKEQNTTYEGHPIRIAAEKEHEANRRDALVRALTRIGISRENYDENMDIDKLQEFYSNHVEELILKQMDEQKEYDKHIEEERQRELEELEEDEEEEESDEEDDEEIYDSEEEDREDVSDEESGEEEEAEFDTENDVMEEDKESGNIPEEDDNIGSNNER